MKTRTLWMLTGLFALILAAPVHSSGFYGSGPCEARNAIEAYCVNHGGCPKDGYCHFPDGSSCELRSFYNGTCPGREYYEQAMWMAEAYSFLYSDWGYSPMPNMYPYNYPYYYQPTYAPGYGM
ncbi:MAG: DUF333 domain-containing protein [Methanothrix sp.]|nr:DUF333 domain-containing protein [Methanothrix sp.]